MYQKDYLLRLIEIFNDAINRIIGVIENDESTIVQDEISSMYKLLGDESYFKKSSKEKIINFFSKETGGLKKLDLLAHLMFLESQLNSINTSQKLDLLEKVKSFWGLYSKHTKEFSFERENNIQRVNLLLEDINNS